MFASLPVGFPSISVSILAATDFNVCDAEWK